jgi:ribosomal protein S18 acetylase RimI-like enzyme
MDGMVHLTREATSDDVEALEVLESALFPDNAMNTHTLLQELLLGRGFVAECGGAAVGYALARVDNDVVDITRIGVLPRCHRQGIARSLMGAALSLAKRAVLLVRKSNDPAIKLYVSMGFKIVGHLINDDSWLMVRGDQNGDMAKRLPHVPQT